MKKHSPSWEFPQKSFYQGNSEHTALAEQSHMLCARSRTHLEYQILQTRRLCRRPMNTRSRVPGRNSRHIQDKVAHLSIEDIGRAPVQILRIVLVGVNEAKPGESSSCLESGDVGWVADKVGIVLVDDRGGNQVRAGWEIDYGGCGSARSAALAAAAAGQDGVVDGCCVICNTVA